MTSHIGGTLPIPDATEGELVTKRTLTTNQGAAQATARANLRPRLRRSTSAPEALSTGIRPTGGAEPKDQTHPSTKRGLRGAMADGDLKDEPELKKPKEQQHPTHQSSLELRHSRII